MSDHAKIIAAISACDDPEKLRTWIENARQRNVPEVADAAFHRLVAILPEEESGTVDHDFWRSIHALEETLSGERGRTVRLSRTRQKISRAGIVRTLGDLALIKKPSEGFAMLLERGMPELTAEAVILRHPESFGPEVLDAARQRLQDAGIETEQATECD